MKIFIIFLLLFSFSAGAVTPIKKGQASPTDGYVFSKKEEKELRKRDQQRIKLSDLNTLKDEKIDIMNQRINNLKDQNKDLKSINKWNKTGYFILGILTSVGSLYVSSVILKNVRK